MLRLICFISVLMIIDAPANSFAQDKGPYILVKPGAFIPTGDLENNGFDTAFSGEIVIGTYYLPNLALEAGVGYYQTEASISGIDFTEEDELSVLPVEITLKGVIPLRGGELNAGIGPGVYFTSMEAKGSTPTGSFSTDSHPAVFGGHVLIGGTIDISKTVFVGAEWKYIFTGTANFSGSKMKLDGFIACGVLGFRL